MIKWTVQEIEEAVKAIVNSVISEQGLVIDNFIKGNKFGPDLGMDELDLGEVIHIAEKVFRISLSDDILTLNSDCNHLVNWVRIRRMLPDQSDRMNDTTPWSDFPEKE